MNKKRKLVIEKLLKEIHGGSIIINGKLPAERNLAQIMGENRAIVREALISLEAMGVIDIRERQGIYVSSREENEAKTILQKVRDWPGDLLSKIIEVRQVLDPIAASLAATRRTPEDIANLTSCLEKMRALSIDDSEGASKTGAYWNTIFHTIIVSATGNTYMAKIYESVLSIIEHHMSLMRASTSPTEYGGRTVAFQEHMQLVEQIKNGNAAEAERIAEEHLSHTVKAMVRLREIVPASDLYSQKLAGRLRFE